MAKTYPTDKPKMIIVFTTTILLSSFLLFAVQPLIGKFLLPYFGGSYSVWITALFFFQFTLFIGYFYSFLISELSVKKQVIIHTTVLIISLLILTTVKNMWITPITPPISSFSINNDFLRVFFYLFVAIGLPFAILSSTTILLQSWFNNAYKKSPYVLYSMSNVGSLLALLSYPILIEPHIKLTLQANYWSYLYVIYLLLVLMSTLSIIKKTSTKKTKVVGNLMGIKILKNKIIFWVLLSAMGSSLLVSSTTFLTQSIASVPLIWLVPLCLYLVSFILTFKSDNWFKPRFFGYLFLLLVSIVLSTAFHTVHLGFISILLVIFTAYTGFMLLHGKLYSVRPDPKYLAIYYLCVSFGGLLGGFFSSLLAPILFVELYEYHITLALITILALFILGAHKKSLMHKIVNNSFPNQRNFQIFSTLVILTSFLTINYFFVKQESIYSQRTFYGLLKVVDTKEDDIVVRQFVSGRILHGLEVLNEETLKPRSYYGDGSGMSLAINNHPSRLKNESMNIGIIGLGIGTVAAYANDSDTLTFFEIDPEVEKIARKYFRFLDHSKGDVKVLIGDGRLVLEKLIKSDGFNKFDILVVDAFTDDSIPVHLVTKEAFDIYLQSLDPKNGLLTVNITNSFVDIAPVLKSLSDELGLNMAIIDQKENNKEFIQESRWVLLARNKSIINIQQLTQAKEPELKSDGEVWTDDYSSILKTLKLLPK